MQDARGMLSSTARKTVTLTDTQQITRSTGALATRKIWLPKAIYDALPWFYLASGIVAFLTTLYISEWFWVLPHYVLFSAACIHFGAVVLCRRAVRSAPEDDAPDPGQKD
jgi:hypothetical protein